MIVDPFIGLLLGLAGWVLVGLFGAWFAGLFEPPAKRPTDVAAE